jgi:hypothetical protein
MYMPATCIAPPVALRGTALAAFFSGSCCCCSTKEGSKLASSTTKGAQFTCNFARVVPSRTIAQKSLRSESLSSQLNVRSHAPSDWFRAPTRAPALLCWGVGSHVDGAGVADAPRAALAGLVGCMCDGMQGCGSVKMSPKMGRKMATKCKMRNAKWEEWCQTQRGRRCTASGDRGLKHCVRSEPKHSNKII